jgi:phospholipid-binding lipoprotein MlaA
VRSAIVIGLLAAALGGCASQNVSIRSLPPENPAAENAAAADSAAAFAAAAGEGEAAADKTAADKTAADKAAQSRPALPPLTPADAPSMATYDPFERMNRFTYRFNARFDEAVYLPVANGYRRIPKPIRSGVHNFFANLTEINSAINYALQWRPKLGVRSAGRFVINSTIGIVGLFDVATRLKLPAAPTGASTTLARWGVPPGPYLVIPLLGPSTLRDGFGFLADYITAYEINVADLYRGWVSWGLGISNAVDLRSNFSYRYYSSGSPFEYENIRFLYTRKRLIEDEGLRAK